MKCVYTKWYWEEGHIEHNSHFVKISQQHVACTESLQVGRLSVFFEPWLFTPLLHFRFRKEVNGFSVTWEIFLGEEEEEWKEESLLRKFFVRKLKSMNDGCRAGVCACLCVNIQRRVLINRVKWDEWIYNLHISVFCMIHHHMDHYSAF